MARWPNSFWAEKYSLHKVCLLLRTSFILFGSLHAYRKNQEECGQMWSGSTHYVLLSGIEGAEEVYQELNQGILKRTRFPRK